MTQAAPSAAVFKSKAREALSDPALLQAMERAKGGFVGARRIAIEELAEFESLRDAAQDIKDHVLNHLDLYLERYERKTIENGGHVHWAQTAEEACEIVKKRSEEHTSELQSQAYLVCRLLLEKTHILSTVLLL